MRCSSASRRVDEPRYACGVVVEHGGGGATVAGPIARDILIECQQRDPARPLGGTSALPCGRRASAHGAVDAAGSGGGN